MINTTPLTKSPLPQLGITMLRTFSQAYQHQLISTEAFWTVGNTALQEALGELAKPETKILYLLEIGLQQVGYEHLPFDLALKADIECKHYTLATAPIWLLGTEICKDNWDGVIAVCQAINDHAIDRHSVVVAVGGGAFLDMVGFGCSIAHRGVNLIRVPTTVLAQADSGVGVKSAINAFGKKNFIGAFGVPLAVINDAAFLKTLSRDLLIAGLAEAVKVALVKDADFFSYLEANIVEAINGDQQKLQIIVKHSAELHLLHICNGGDPFERGSSRPLDFGHWSAHKAEGLSQFTIPHGLAVAAGVHLDALYSHQMGWLSASGYGRIKALIIAMGYDLAIGAFGKVAYDPSSISSADTLLNGLNEFREHLGGRLTLLMLQDIGQPIEVYEVDQVVMRRAINNLVT